jgi:CrcB protein
MDKILMVAAGGAIGAVLRFLISGWVGRAFAAGYAGTFFVNVAGSLVMGVLAVLMMERFAGVWGKWAPFAMTGVLGGFTTFSAYSLDALSLIEKGRFLVASAYIGGSVVVSILALLAGMMIARAMI